MNKSTFRLSFRCLEFYWHPLGKFEIRWMKERKIMNDGTELIVYPCFCLFEGAHVFIPGIVIRKGIFDIRIFGLAWMWRRGYGWEKRLGFFVSVMRTSIFRKLFNKKSIYE